MPSSDSSLPPVPPATAPQAVSSPTPVASPDTVERQRGHVTVMHPAGIPAYAAEGLTHKKPLFARVTYRPTA